MCSAISPGDLGGVGSDHEMRGSGNSFQRRSRQALTEQFVGALHGSMACPTTEHQHRHVDGAEQRVSEARIVGTRPIADVHRGRLNGIGAHALRPGGKRAGATVKVDHRRDRVRLAVAEGGEVGIRHASEGAIVLVLAGFPQQFRGRRLYNRQAGHRHVVSERDRERH